MTEAFLPVTSSVKSQFHRNQKFPLDHGYSICDLNLSAVFAVAKTRKQIRFTFNEIVYS